MDSKAERKEAIRKFKERKPLVGAYGVRCTASGRVFVGTSLNLEATKNRVWFGLRLGSHIDKALQQEWNAYGEEKFQYEILETLDEDLAPLQIPDVLKEKKRHWIAELNAQALT